MRVSYNLHGSSLYRVRALLSFPLVRGRYLFSFLQSAREDEERIRRRAVTCFLEDRVEECAVERVSNGARKVAAMRGTKKR